MRFSASVCENRTENAGEAGVHDGLFARPSDTEAIDAYLPENGTCRLKRRQTVQALPVTG